MSATGNLGLKSDICSETATAVVARINSNRSALAMQVQNTSAYLEGSEIHLDIQAGAKRRRDIRYYEYSPAADISNRS
jgi:hypothetical protein